MDTLETLDHIMIDYLKQDKDIIGKNINLKSVSFLISEKTEF